MATDQSKAAVRSAPSGSLHAIATPATTAALVIAALFFGRDILVPLALGTLLAFVLTPLVTFLRRYWIPRTAAIVTAVTVALAVVALVAFSIGTQLVQLAKEMPSYQRNIADKIESVRTMSTAGSVLGRVVDSFRALEAQISTNRPQQPAAVPTPERPRQEPLPVIVESPPVRPLDVLFNIVRPIMGPIGTTGLVIIFVVFILLEREELRDRFIRLFGGDDIQRSSQLISDAASRVSRYLLTQLIVNVSYGIAVTIGLMLIGVPNAVLWGMLAAILRFVPYIGPWIAALFPIAIAIGSEPGWSLVLWTIALFLVLELVSNNIVEPWLYGTSTGLSSFAIILAAIFWTVMWGPLGLLLSTPLTVCLVVIGRHVPRLAFLDLLLSSEPALSPAERFYQRLVAADHDEALDIAEAEIEKSSPRTFYDGVALAALIHAETDRARGTDPALHTTLRDNLASVLADLPDSEQIAPSTGLKIVCVAGRTDIDFAAATLIAHRLQQLGHVTKALDHRSLAPYAIGEIDLDDVDIVLLCHLTPRPETFVRHACRRLSRAPGSYRIALALLNLAEDADASRCCKACGESTILCASLADIESVFAGRSSINGPASQQAVSA